MSSKRIKVGMRGIFSCDVGGGLKRCAVQIENSVGFCVLCVHFEKMKVDVRDVFFLLFIQV